MKALTIIMFISLLISRGLQVYYPLILKKVIQNITCVEDTLTQCASPAENYSLIVIYAVTRFISDFLNYIRELPFAEIGANAEKNIAAMVYRHIQNQNLTFHLSRETGRIVRVVSKGGNSFQQVLRFIFFNILPMVLQTLFFIIIIGVLYGWTIFFINASVVVVFYIVTVLVTEWRSKFFKKMAT